MGHNFLARLGKTKLRPGGVAATSWLMARGNFSQETKILEVACNRCTTAITLAQKYHAQIEGIDLSLEALAVGQKNIEAAGLEQYIHLQQGNALKLPFPDNSFDVVINEAMLTMLSTKAKEKALQEYYRVLKPGGRLLTHDIGYFHQEAASVLADLRQTIHVNVEPLHMEHWQQLLTAKGFQAVTQTHGKMTLLSPSGLLRDEGFLGTIKMLRRGLQKENRQQFQKMYRFFNHTGKKLRYVAFCSVK